MAPHPMIISPFSTLRRTFAPDAGPRPTNERKFAVPAERESAVLAHLRAFCRPAGDHPFNTVSSLYLDTPGLSLYSEKSNGDLLKAKVRLRWYTDPSGSCEGPVFLEFKRKDGSGRRKSRLALPCTGARFESGLAAASDARAFVEDLLSGAGCAVPAGLFPSLVVRYERHRFLCPFSGSGVNLDTRIRSGWVNPFLVRAAPRAESAEAVLEVKARGLPDLPWLAALHALGLRARSFSKYGFCVEQITGGQDY